MNLRTRATRRGCSRPVCGSFQATASSLKRIAVPIRSCAACGATRPKTELVRIARTPSGRIEVDPGQRKPGRGAYVCPSAACIRIARKRRSLSRVLRTSVPPQIYDELMQLVQDDRCGS